MASPTSNELSMDKGRIAGNLLESRDQRRVKPAAAALADFCQRRINASGSVKNVNHLSQQSYP